FDIPDGLKNKHVLYSAELHPSTGQRLRAAKKRGARGTTEVLEHIKSYASVYIPGASIKGAIRTSILVDAIEKDPSLLDIAERVVNTSRVGDKFASRRLEREVFGKDPQHDIMRALIVSDSEELEIHEGTLSVEEVRIVPMKERGSLSLFCETIKPGVRLTCSTKLDEFVLAEGAASALEFAGRRWMVEDVCESCNRFARMIISHELDYFSSLGDEYVGIVEQYERLYERLQGLAENAFLLRVGWGTGWLSHTIGAVLKREGIDATKIVRTLSRSNVLEQFPKSRKLIYRGDAPYDVLGWVEVRIT
ncbi:MAG: type III-A CRISPR-associated RAMP protein Csm5, partial [Methermicoccaceae archaeon]